MGAMGDKGFLEDAGRGGMEVNPIEPERLQELVERAYSLPTSMIERLTKLQQPPGPQAKVQYKTIRAKLAKIDKGRAEIEVVGGGHESISIRPDDTKVTIAGHKAEANAVRPGMVCKISYLGNKTTAESINCE